MGAKLWSRVFDWMMKIEKVHRAGAPPILRRLSSAEGRQAAYHCHRAEVAAQLRQKCRSRPRSIRTHVKSSNEAKPARGCNRTDNHCQCRCQPAFLILPFIFLSRRLHYILLRNFHKKINYLSFVSFYPHKMWDNICYFGHFTSSTFSNTPFFLVFQQNCR